MDIRQITPQFFVSPQISPADMPALKEQGFSRVLCNRPDAEVPPSHFAQEMQAAAEAEGLEFACHPLTHQTMTPDVIDKNSIDAQGEKVLAYCASGTRSTIAWALGQAGKQPAADIIAAGRDAGYDLTQLRGYLEAAEG